MRRVAALLAAGLPVRAAPAAQAAPKRIVALSPFTANTLADLGVRPVAIGQIRSAATLLAQAAGRPAAPPLAPQRPEPRAARRAEPAARALVADVEPRPPRDAAARHARRGDASRAASTRRRETRRIGALVGKRRRPRDRRAHAAGVAARQARDPQAPARARGARRRPHALRVPAQLVGRRPRQPRRRPPAHRRPEGERRLRADLQRDRRRAQPGHHHRGPARHPARHPELAATCANNPAWRTTNAARGGRVYVSTGNSLLQPWTDVGRMIRDVRAKFLKN